MYLLAIATVVSALDMPESPTYGIQAGKFFRELEPQELVIGKGSWPCIFQMGTDFYDYTKFKLA